MTPIERQYLLTVFITEPQAEHGKIKDVIHDLSHNNFQIVMLHRTCIAIAFSSHLGIIQIRSRLEGLILNEDRRLLVELGSGWATFGLDRAATWFHRNLGDPK